MTLALNYGIAAYFKVELARQNKHGELIDRHTVREFQKNLITNSGMDAIGSTAYSLNFYSLTNYLNIGNGSGTPAFTDTALFNKVATVQAGGIGDNIAAWDTVDTKRWYLQRVYQFPAGAAAGNMTELGFSSSTTGSIYSHALFKNEFGDNAPITVAADQILIVTYRIYFKASETDSVLTTTINGVSTTITLRPAKLGVEKGFSNTVAGHFNISGVVGAGNYTNAFELFMFTGTSSNIGATTAGPTGTQVYISGSYAPITFGTYTNGSYTREDTLIVNQNAPAATDIGAFLNRGAAPFQLQIGISPRISKNSTQSIRIKIRTSWARM